MQSLHLWLFLSSKTRKGMSMKKIIALFLAVVLLLGTGITEVFAVTIGGVNYSHPVNVENSTVWYNESGDSRQIGGDAHTYNLIKKYEGDQSANNFFAGRGGKIKINGAALNQNLWKKNKDTTAWKNNATNYSWLAQNGAGSVLNNSVTGKVYLSDKEYNSKNKAFAVVGAVGDSPSGRRYNINRETFRLKDPLLQLTPVYQETTGKAGFWLARNQVNVQYQGLSESQMKQMPVTISGTNVPSGKNTGSLAAASNGSVRRTMTYGGSLDGSAVVNPSSAEEQVYNYITCDTYQSNKTLAFSNLSYGNWSASIKNNTSTDYTLQVQIAAREGYIYKRDTSGAGDHYNIKNMSKTIDFPRGSSLSLPASQMIADGYINYTLKLIPKTPNKITANILGLDSTDRGQVWTSLENKKAGTTELFFDNNKTWSNLSAGSYDMIITPLSSLDYDVKMTLDYKNNKASEIKTIERTFKLSSVTTSGGEGVLSKIVSDLVQMDDGGMANFTFEFMKDVSGRRIQVNLNGLVDDDWSDTINEGAWSVKKADSVNGTYSPLSVLPWFSGGRSVELNLKNTGASNFFQTDFSIANRSQYYIQSVDCTVYDTATGQVIRSYDRVAYPDKTAVAATTKLPYNLNGDGKKMTLDGSPQNGVQVEAGQTAVYDITLKKQGILSYGEIKTYFNMDYRMKTDNSDGLSVALCQPDLADSLNPDGIIAIGRFKDGFYSFGSRPTGKKYVVKFLDYDKVDYAVSPTANDSPTTNSLPAIGFTAIFEGKCSPIEAVVQGGEGVSPADLGGILIEVMTYDEDAQQFVWAASLKTDSSGKVTFQPTEFNRQYYFAPAGTPDHCYFTRSIVASEKYTGAGQTVTLPMEKLQAVHLEVTRAAGVTEPVSNKKIDVYEGTLTNSGAVDNGAEPVYNYQLVDTVQTDSAGQTDYFPDRAGLNLKFVPQTLANEKLRYSPEEKELRYTGRAENASFRIMPRYQPLIVKCNDETTHASSKNAQVQVTKFVSDTVNGETIFFTENGETYSLKGRFEEYATVSLSTASGNGYGAVFQPAEAGIYSYEIITQFPPAEGYTFQVLPSKIIRTYTGDMDVIPFSLYDSSQRSKLTVQFRDTNGRAVTGISGTLASNAADGKEYKIETDASGSCAVYGLTSGYYQFVPSIVPGGLHPVSAGSCLYNAEKDDTKLSSKKEITYFEEYEVQVIPPQTLAVMPGYAQIVTYILQREESNDIDISFHVPNAGYKKGTEVVSTFILQNNTDKAYTPDAPLSVSAMVRYTEGGVEKTKSIGGRNDVILPPNGSQVVYFCWNVPAGADSENCVLTATVTAGDATPMVGSNTVTASMPLVERIVSTTPDTKFDTKSGKTFTYGLPTANKEYHNLTRWEEWVWENGNFVKKTYEAKLKTRELTIWPDETNPSSTFDPGNGYTMRSGYAIKLRYHPAYFSNAPENAMTKVQDAQSFFPEFYFTTEKGKYKTLEPTGEDWWKFYVDPHSTYRPGEKGDGRKHFTPMWFPDKPYKVQILATDCWTPVGMLSNLDGTNMINIRGSLYDDWYVSSGGSSIGSVEIQGGN